MQHHDQSVNPFNARVVRALEQVSLWASGLAVAAVIASATGEGELSASGRNAAAMWNVGTLVSLSVFSVWLGRRWNAEWLIYCAEVAFVGSYLYYRTANPLPPSIDAFVLLLFAVLDFGFSQLFKRLQLSIYARPTFYFSLFVPLVLLVLALEHGQFDTVNMLIVFSTASFYGVVSYQKQWKRLGYWAAVLYNAFLWIAWAREGWKLTDHPQFYLVPVGLSAILFAEVNRRELGRQTLNLIRSLGSMVIYVSTAIPIWQFQSFGSWLALLLLSLIGIFFGIGLRVQVFVWLGLVCCIFDVAYQLGHVGSYYPLAKGFILVGLGLLLVGFLALNEKMRIAPKMREYYKLVRQWE